MKTENNYVSAVQEHLLNLSEEKQQKKLCKLLRNTIYRGVTQASLCPISFEEGGGRGGWTQANNMF